MSLIKKKNKKRILFLAPRFPLPADSGGKIRTWNILKQLAKHADIHLVCFSYDKTDGDWLKELERQGVFVSLISAPESSTQTTIANILFKNVPHAIVKYYSKDMESFVQRLVSTFSFDAVHVDHLHMTHYRSCLNGIPCVVDEHNVESKILERCAKVEPSLWKKVVYESQAKKMLSYESNKVREFNRCLAVSEEDQKILQNLTQDQVKIEVIANGVDTEYFKTGNNGQLSPDKLSEESLVFTGSMDWLPNDDAVVYFCKEILPKVWEKNKNIKFYVVGKNPSAQIREMAEKEDRIIVTGRVDDVRPYIERSKIFVVPIRVGGGTRLKILEAMSMKKTVISTRVGAEGIGYADGKDIILADEPREFANGILKAMDDNKGREHLGKCARELVERDYDWNVIGKKLKEIYNAVIQ